MRLNTIMADPAHTPTSDATSSAHELRQLDSENHQTSTFKVDWPPFFRALGEALLPYEYRQEELVALLNDIGVAVGDDGGLPLQVMDPLSFVLNLKKYTRADRLIGFFTELHRRLNLQVTVPTVLNGFSVVHVGNQNGVANLFAKGQVRGERDLTDLWALAGQALSGNLADDTFDRVINRDKKLLPRLTQALYILNPEKFLPLDPEVSAFLAARGVQGSTQIHTRQDLMHILEQARTLAPNFISLMTEFGHSQTSSTEPDFPATASPSDNQAPLFEFRTLGIAARGRPHGKGFVVLAGSQARSQVTDSYTVRVPSGYQKHRERLIAEGILQSDPKTGELVFTQDEEFKGSTEAGCVVAGRMANGIREWFTVLPDGTRQRHAQWLEQLARLADPGEIEAVSDRTTLLEEFIHDPLVPLNQILYGPPGTGKTYQVVERALAILDPAFLTSMPERAAMKARYDTLVAQGQISFVTFHQSFGYEDFIEGIKPLMSGGTLSYVLQDGVFLNAVRAAGGNLAGESLPTSPILESRIRSDAQVWRIYIDGTAPISQIRERALARGEIRVGSWLADPLTLDSHHSVASTRPTDLTTLPEDQLNAQQHAFKDSLRAGDLVLLATGIDRIGAVGVVTGEYGFDVSEPLFAANYAHVRPVKWLAQGLTVSATTTLNKTFSQQTLQRVAGVTAGDMLAKLDLGQTLELATSPKLPTPRPHVLIIDEINRGNISKIFGELITLLESSKRAGAGEALTVTLPLSRRPLSVPKDLYVIGTMNTADRSLTLLDAALRRRFVFRPVWPEPEVLPVLTLEGGTALDLRKFLYVINERIERLLSREQVIGHAYLLGLPKSLDGVASAVRERILPLLEEYFFEDWSKIREVLGDPGRPPALQFIHQIGTGADVRYRLNPDAFGEIEAFTGVYGGVDDVHFPFDA